MVAPLIVAAMTPFVKDLFAKGLSLLGNAVLEKGKAAVEEKLGVKLPAENTPLTAEQAEAMRKLQFDHEEALLELAIRKEELALAGEREASIAVTKRWEADMLSDSWLSKNIRPLALIHTLAAFDILLICALFDVTIPDGYLTIVSSLLLTMVAAYFVGRSVEKGVDVYQGWKNTKGD